MAKKNGKSAKKDTTEQAPQTEPQNGSPLVPESAENVMRSVSKYQGFVTLTIHRSKIKNAEYNPRYLGPAQKAKLKRSLEKFKLVEPMVWNQRTENLVGGHQRLGLIDQLEGTQDYFLTVAAIDVDEVTEKSLNIALNNPELQGQYDQDLLHEVVGSLFNESPAALKDAGFDNSSLGLLFGDEFLLDAPKKQAQLDAPIVSDLNEMYEVGSEEIKKKKAPPVTTAVAPSNGDDDASSGNQPAPAAPQPAGQPATGRLPGERPPESRVFTVPADAGPDQSGESPPDSSQPMLTEPNPDAYRCGWTKEDFKARRKQYAGDKQTLDEADVFFSLVFDSAEQGTAWLHSLNIDPSIRTMDLTAFCAAIGFDLDAAVKSYRELREQAEREINEELGIDQPSGPE